MRHREQILAALADRLKSVGGIATFDRRLRHWEEVPPAEQPALFMLAAGQTVESTGRGLPALRVNVNLYLYSRTDGPDSQNDLLDALDDALEPDDGECENTLGGLVESCRIEGQIETDEGLLDRQSVAIVPIVILVP